MLKASLGNGTTVQPWICCWKKSCEKGPRKTCLCPSRWELYLSPSLWSLPEPGYVYACAVLILTHLSWCDLTATSPGFAKSLTRVRDVHCEQWLEEDGAAEGSTLNVEDTSSVLKNAEKDREALLKTLLQVFAVSLALTSMSRNMQNILEVCDSFNLETSGL